MKKDKTYIIPTEYLTLYYTRGAEMTTRTVLVRACIISHLLISLCVHYYYYYYLTTVAERCLILYIIIKFCELVTVCTYIILYIYYNVRGVRRMRGRKGFSKSE